MEREWFGVRMLELEVFEKGVFVAVLWNLISVSGLIAGLMLAGL